MATISNATPCADRRAKKAHYGFIDKHPIQAAHTFATLVFYRLAIPVVHLLLWQKGDGMAAAVSQCEMWVWWASVVSCENCVRGCSWPRGRYPSIHTIHFSKNQRRNKKPTASGWSCSLTWKFGKIISWLLEIEWRLWLDSVLRKSRVSVEWNNVEAYSV